MTKIIIQHDGDEITIASPYSETLRQALSALPRADRRWDAAGACWRVQPHYLDRVRTLAAQTARQAKWVVFDYTSRSSENMNAEIQAQVEAEVEAHVSNFLKILPGLPSDSLILTHWSPGDLETDTGEPAADPTPGSSAIYLEIAGLLGEKQFKQLREAIGLRKVDRGGTGRWVMAVPNDPRIVRALWSRGDVRHLRPLQGLHLMRDLGHGRFELFDGADGRAWLGARYQQVTYRPWRPECEDWSVAVVDDEILLAFNREDYFRRLIGQDPTLIRFKNSTNLSLNSGDMVAATAGMFDCSDWLKDWVQTRVNSDQLNRRPLHGGKGREPQNYRHPADEILALFGDGQDGQVMEGQKLAELVGWSAAEIDSFRTRIEVLKLAAATARVEADRANASELARPILAQRTRDSLLALAVEWQAPVRRSAKKAQIIEALVTDQDLAERLIGL